MSVIIWLKWWQSPRGCWYCGGFPYSSLKVGLWILGEESLVEGKKLIWVLVIAGLSWQCPCDVRPRGICLGQECTFNLYIRFSIGKCSILSFNPESLQVEKHKVKDNGPPRSVSATCQPNRSSSCSVVTLWTPVAVSPWGGGAANHCPPERVWGECLVQGMSRAELSSNPPPCARCLSSAPDHSQAPPDQSSSSQEPPDSSRVSGSFIVCASDPHCPLASGVSPVFT